MAYPPSELIPLQSDLRERDLSTFDSVCGCGDAANHPFYEDCQSKNSTAQARLTYRKLMGDYLQIQVQPQLLSISEDSSKL